MTFCALSRLSVLLAAVSQRLNPELSGGHSGGSAHFLSPTLRTEQTHFNCNTQYGLFCRLRHITPPGSFLAPAKMKSVKNLRIYCVTTLTKVVTKRKIGAENRYQTFKIFFHEVGSKAMCLIEQVVTFKILSAVLHIQ